MTDSLLLYHLIFSRLPNIYSSAHIYIRSRCPLPKTFNIPALKLLSNTSSVKATHYVGYEQANRPFNFIQATSSWKIIGATTLFTTALFYSFVWNRNPVGSTHLHNTQAMPVSVMRSDCHQQPNTRAGSPHWPSSCQDWWLWM